MRDREREIERVRMRKQTEIVTENLYSKFFLGRKQGEMKLQTGRQHIICIIYLKKTGPKFLSCSFGGASKFFTKLPVKNTKNRANYRLVFV